MNCDNCLARLQSGETNGDGNETDCLGRVCQVIAQKHSHAFDSLGVARRQPKFPATKKLQDEDDFSYISELDWSSGKPKASKRFSRGSRLWSRPGMIGRQKDPKSSGSVSSATTMTGLDPITPSKPAAVDGNQNGSRRKKRKGRKKDPLHYMEMPMSTDGSVASWIEQRRNMRALMHYDEADQDWV